MDGRASLLTAYLLSHSSQEDSKGTVVCMESRNRARHPCARCRSVVQKYSSAQPMYVIEMNLDWRLNE